MPKEMCQFRLDPEDRTRLDAFAEAAGLTRSDYIRSAIFRKRIVTRKRPPADAAALLQISVQLGRQASALKQVLKAAMAQESISRAEVKETWQAYRRCSSLVEKALSQ
jgi:predicted transcriptional regulator